MAASLSSCDSGSNSTKGDSPAPQDTSGTRAGMVAAPVFSPSGGTYATAQTVAITSSTSDAAIHYTTDGSIPTASSAQYSSLVSVGASTTLRAVAVKGGLSTSSVSSAEYTITGGSAIPWNGSLVYGSLKDARDDKTYRSVQIGARTWMAENLNYAGVGACIDDRNDSCAKYGRLYTWAEVMDGAGSSGSKPSGVRGICPEDWHIPSEGEWSELIAQVDSATAGNKLKSASGWIGTGNGSDEYGFRALPAGYRSHIGSSHYSGKEAYWWSATEVDTTYARIRATNYIRSDFAATKMNKLLGYSLRCVLDP
jgi:uncharacterized protein (TIGR02145 family)